MIAEFGHFVLVLALAVALVQAIAPLYLMQRDTALALPLARRAALAQFIRAVGISGAHLRLCALRFFARRCLPIVMSPSRSSIKLPVWGNHEGSMLLWVLIVAITARPMARFQKPKTVFSARVLMVQAGLAWLFCLSPVHFKPVCAAIACAV